jgi:hypothetical protein
MSCLWKLVITTTTMLQSEKTWFTLVVIGFVEVLIFIAYQVYSSLTGQNVDLVKKIDDSPITETLNVENLTMLEKLQSNILVKDEDLN